MPAAQAPVAIYKSESNVSQPRQTVVKPAAIGAKGGSRVEWVALGAFWLLALGSIAIYSLNFRTVIETGNPFERTIRQTAAQTQERPDPLAPLANQAPPIMLDPDSYCWISIAQQQARDGAFRTRNVTYDNAPKGRAMHWSSSFSWWLILLGAVKHGLTGMAMPQAIAASAAWANPILFALFLTALMWVLRKRANVWTVGVLAVTLASLHGVSWDFGYARPDHHGLHQIAFLGMLISLLAAGLGWVRYAAAESGRWLANGEMEYVATGSTTEFKEEDAEQNLWLLARAPSPVAARRWFTISGICGGMGLWIGATQQMFLLGAAGAGVALGILLFARPALTHAKIDRGTRFMPVLWRHWGQVGAATSFLFYLLEYFPNHLRMRLEVNHPLYALAFLGGGEMLCALGRWRACMGEEDMESRLKRGIMLGLACLSLLPLAVLCGPRDWYVLRETILLRMMKTVTEGLPFIEHWSVWGFLHEMWQAFGTLPFALPLAAIVLLRRRHAMPPRLRAALCVGAMASLVCLGWMFIQTRWVGLAGAALTVLAALIVPAAGNWSRRALPWGLLALTAPSWANYWLVQSSTYGEPPMQHVRTLLPETLADEELAWTIRLRSDEAGIAAPSVMSPMGAAPALHYFGGVNSVGSLYWENVPGGIALADFYGDTGDAAARRIARERKLDFVVAVTRPVFVQQMQWLKFGNVQTAGARRTLAFRLSNPVNPQPPDWLEPVSLRDAPLAERGFRLYRVRRDRL